MEQRKITISWDELNSSEVEQKVKRQEDLLATQQHFQSAPAPEALHRHKRTGLWYNTIVHMSVFGLLAAIIGWAGGEIMHFVRPNLRADAQSLLSEQQDVNKAYKSRQLTENEARRALTSIEQRGRNNPYFGIYTNPDLNEAQRVDAIRRIETQERGKDFIADILFYGACGLMIALGLAIAEPAVERNLQGVIINGSVGATLGLFGGVAVSLFINRVRDAVLAGGIENATSGRLLLASAVTWSILGLFLSIAPGVVLRNFKRMFIGLAGGLIGGAVGGLLVWVVARFTNSDHLSRLAGIAAIGLIAGLSTGLIENVAKSGWLKVTAGLIAGKQFVLYRNPTYVGSSPNCQIYLFKDPKVGRRHAAVHVLRGGFEMENLPLGTPTFVNSKPITRVRLKNGDQIRIGATAFVFNEKARRTTT